ncbi:expressed unknown protein [Seminavis robusta]|uniref:Uncharacterized protein n=1 Tax=Seminavis robusta TaxID=568900 RepID=A0A9N8E3B0_9STRA|nr:expressed unknown protein [Seminavis robusta]|eukprot:Sro502_g155480.1 n/a (85) ;mRNA; f:3813-4067
MELTFQGDGTLTGKRNAADGATTVLKGQWCSGSFTWKEADPKNDKILLAMANGVYDKNARGVLSVVGDFRTASKSLGKLRYKST